MRFDPGFREIAVMQMFVENKAADPDDGVDFRRESFSGQGVNLAAKALGAAVPIVFVHGRIGAKQVVVSYRVHHGQVTFPGAAPGGDRKTGQVIGMDEVRFFGQDYPGQAGVGARVV